MEPDTTQALKDTENALRDFIAATLEQSLGTDWIEKCGVTPERIKKWKERKEAEAKRQESGVVEERVLYYADFYDIPTILKKHWDKFSSALGDWKTMEVYLAELEKVRDPDAHRRELMPHQKHLVAGISGEVRNRIIRYRSKQETNEAFFPRIESARDSLGNIWTPSHAVFGALHACFTNMTLHPGDVIEFVITASDPMGDPLEYCLDDRTHPLGSVWQEQNSFSRLIDDRDICTNFVVTLGIRSGRSYHAKFERDDEVAFGYAVLPSRRSNKL